MTAIICSTCGLGNDMGPDGDDFGFNWETSECASCAAGEPYPWEVCGGCWREYDDVGEGDVYRVDDAYLFCVECAAGRGVKT